MGALPNFDPDLKRLADAWPTLPHAVKASILRLIDDARQSQ